MKRLAKSLLFSFYIFLFTSVIATAQKAQLATGPMVAWSEMLECAVWVQTTAPAQVQLSYYDIERPGNVMMSRPIPTNEATGNTATLVADKVTPGHRYHYDVLVNKKKSALSYPTEFQSQRLWQYRTDPPEFTIATGSCNYVCDSVYDRPGKCYGSDHQIFDALAKARPDAMLWLGDNTYTREPDWNSRTGMVYRYSHTRRLPQMQPLLAATHNYAIWDDHDYGVNDADRAFWQKNLSQEVFNAFWPMLNTNQVGRGGCTGTFMWGDAQFFLMDDRWYRAPNDDRDSARPYFGAEQLQWLKDALTTSRATFKIICGGGQMISPVKLYENYAQYPVEHRAFFKAIAESGARGVMLLSGDRHHTELMKVDRPGTYPLYELTCSSLTAGVANPKEVNPSRVEGTLLKQHNYALLKFTGRKDDRQLIMSLRDVNGAELWSRTIAAKELR